MPISTSAGALAALRQKNTASAGARAALTVPRATSAGAQAKLTATLTTSAGAQAYFNIQPITAPNFTVHPQQGYVTLDWTNPSEFIGGTRIEGFWPLLGDWVLEYDLPLPPLGTAGSGASRNLYPTPGIAWEYRVSVSDGAGAWSVPTVFPSGTMPPTGSLNLSTILTSVDDPTLIVFLGAVDNHDAGINWVGVRDVKQVLASGQADVDMIRTMQTSYLSDQIDYLLPPYQQDDGSRMKTTEMSKRLRRMWEEDHLLQYRNFRDQIFYVRMTTPPRIRLHSNQIDRASFGLMTVAPPQFPLTS